MFANSMMRRLLAAGLMISAVGLWTVAQAAQARPIVYSPSSSVPAQLSPGVQRKAIADPPSFSRAQAVSTPAASQPTANAQSGFQWGDAGIGALGALVLLGGGVGVSGAMRRRQAHRAVVG